MYVQSAIPEMYDNVSDMIFHREYFTTVCLSQHCCVAKKNSSLVAVCHRTMNV